MDKNTTVFRTTIYTDNKYPDTDQHITQVFKDEYEMEVDGLLFAMEGYVVVSGELVRSRSPKLIKHLKNGDYIKYYKLIEKIAKQCRKSLE